MEDLFGSPSVINLLINLATGIFHKSHQRTVLTKENAGACHERSKPLTEINRRSEYFD